MKRLIFAIALSLLAASAGAGGPWYINEGQTSVVRNIVLYDATDPDAFLIGLTSEDSGLTVRFCDNVGNCTTYDATTEFETIAGHGTYTAPSANNVRIVGIGGGIYQMQFADALWAGTDAAQGVLTIDGAGVYPMSIEVFLDGVNAAALQAANEAAIDAQNVAREATLNATDDKVDSALAAITNVQDDVVSLGTDPDAGGTGMYLADESLTSVKFGTGAFDVVGLMNATTIDTLASQVSFTLVDGSPDDNAYNGMFIVIVDQTTSTQKARGRIRDYTGSTKTVTLEYDPGVFTMAEGDLVYIQAN